MTNKTLSLPASNQAVQSGSAQSNYQSREAQNLASAQNLYGVNTECAAPDKLTISVDPDHNFSHIDGFVASYKRLNCKSLGVGTTPLSILHIESKKHTLQINALKYFAEVRKRWRDVEDTEVESRLEVAFASRQELEDAIKTLMSAVHVMQNPGPIWSLTLEQARKGLPDGWVVFTMDVYPDWGDKHGGKNWQSMPMYNPTKEDIMDAVKEGMDVTCDYTHRAIESFNLLSTVWQHVIDANAKKKNTVTCQMYSVGLGS